jgi:hypothetical protein
MLDMSADDLGWVLTALFAAALLAVVAGIAVRWLHR